jgi:biotin operon repressor
MIVTLLDALSLDWQTKDQLAAAMDCTTREVEAAIQQHRLAGAAILSSSAAKSAGYRLARNAAEVNECLERLRHRALHQLVTVRALRLTRDRLRAEESRPLVVDLPVPVVRKVEGRPEWPAWT